MQQAARSTRVPVVASVLVCVGMLATLVAGRAALSIFVAVVVMASYVDLRRLLADGGHPVTFVLGGAAVAACMWAGYEGDLALVPAFVAALVLVTLLARTLLHETGAPAEGVTGDIAATVGAAALVGVLGAHIVLIRALPRHGFRGLLALIVMAAAAIFAALAVRRIRAQRAAPTSAGRSASAVAAGVVAAAAAGAIVGAVLNPPFGAPSGLAFGAAVGVLVPLGDLAFAALRRSVRSRTSVPASSAVGVLDFVGGPLFVAPAFYWAFRTVAL